MCVCMLFFGLILTMYMVRWQMNDDRMKVGRLLLNIRIKYFFFFRNRLDFFVVFFCATHYVRPFSISVSMSMSHRIAKILKNLC